ncbi:hypothetical protein [Demequina salsinemoris]|uniref:hypothetical protein n=1 Tax=Demequina salsinemoris TaxID=577470 RepID=UPI000783115E|nr:hypothetical protein [Demequina salsinemoris]
MTTIESVPGATVPDLAPLARRIGAVLRIHLAGPFLTLIQPWIVTAVIFAVNLAVYGMIAYAAGGVSAIDDDAFKHGGSVSWVFVFMIVVAVQAMHFTFRFALGLSIDRRDYYLGTLAFFGMLAVTYSIGLTLCAGFERVTGGWWLNAAFFAPIPLDTAPLVTVAYVFVVGFLLAFAVGAFSASVWVRWGARGLYWYFGILAFAVVGLLWSITAAGAWGDVWEFLSLTSLAEIATWALPLVAVCAAGGWLLLRRAPLSA